MSTGPKICLILDNPLRDFDGLVLLAWQLARLGAQVWLVPMYDQGFDVRAIGADFVLLNYIRVNNLDYALSYMRRGMKVGVLDTEGIGGRSLDEFAQLISTSGAAQLVDMYCVWGKGQQRVLSQQGVVSEDKLRLTGSPRYDYCAKPWRECLPHPSVTPGYVLINTNFPGINSRFVRSVEDERRAIINGGYSETMADEHLRDSRLAHEGMIELIRKLIVRFPKQHFVLRPHPFESSVPYEQAIQGENFTVKQEGTSIEWLNQARALIHLNCLTAIEAAAFGIPALSPAWMDKPSLSVSLSSELSLNFDNEESLFGRLSQELVKPMGTKSTGVDSGSIVDTYLLNDGRASERVAQAIMDTLSCPALTRTLPSPKPRFYLLNNIRRLVGPAFYGNVLDRFYAPQVQARKKAKQFSIDQVTEVITRIEQTTGETGRTKVMAMSHVSLPYPGLASGRSACLSRKG